MEDIEELIKKNEEKRDDADRMKIGAGVCAVESLIMFLCGKIALIGDFINHSTEKRTAAIAILSLSAFNLIAAGLCFLKSKKESKEVAANDEYIVAVKKEHEDAISRSR